MSLYKLWKYHDGKEIRENQAAKELIDRHYIEKLGIQGEVLLEHKMTDLEWWSYIDSCLQKSIQNYKDIKTVN